MKSKSANILIAGTPGTGKTSICQKVIKELTDNYIYLNIGDYVKEHKLYEEYDNERDCYVLDEDALIDHLEHYMEKEKKGFIFDFHGCDLFPSEWLDAIFVLRTSNDLLYQRLKDRNYSDSKLNENLECEIFQVILDEARELGEDNIEVIELINNTEQDQTNNVDKILNWIKSKNS